MSQHYMANGQISCKLVSFILAVKNTLVLTNTLAYYKILYFQIGNACMVQAPGIATTIPYDILSIITYMDDLMIQDGTQRYQRKFISP
jgi:hypothetical protein